MSKKQKERTYTQITDLMMEIECDNCGEYIEYICELGTLLTDDMVEQEFKENHSC